MDSGCVMTSNQNFKKADNVLLVKVQSAIWKKPVHFDILKTDSFHILYIKCAEEANMSINEFKLRYKAFAIINLLHLAYPAVIHTFVML